MRFPWNHREEVAKERADRARREYEETLKNTERLKRVTEANRREVQANGWTEAIVNIAKGRPA